MNKKQYCDTDSIQLYSGEEIQSKSETNTTTIQNHFWGPNKTILNLVEKYCITNKCEQILEIGPGKVPFKLATDFIGSNETITSYIEIDIDKQLLPYSASQFDFIYCRHVLEDIQNPEFALSEMIRISKSGYIETPSPLIEITKDVDAAPLSDKYCGYIHHRYIVWSSIEKNEIYFLPKYSCILDHMLNITHDIKSHLYNLINNKPIYWNNYFIYDVINSPKIIMYKNGVNFNTKGRTMVEDYISLITRAINESIENTNYFIHHFNNTK
jgi:hypothetical protein